MSAADEPLPEGTWRRDRIPGGWRYWTTLSRRYSEPDQFRPALITAITEMRWYPPNPAVLPMWPGLGLVELIRTEQFSGVGGLGVSETPLEFPEDAYLDAYLERGAEPVWATYSLLGIKQVLRDGWQMSYFLDKGVDIGGIAIDVVAEQHPADISMLCLLDRHDECTGTYKTQSWIHRERVPCQCECGCQARSQRRASDDRVDQLDHEGQDFEPDRQGGTVTHDEPPKQE
ncbi:hypothetical protein [Nocardia sp. NPDC005366]|uniref:hypothetical protein n=1 Tax=Nocardia sp. NPDC005366 TaxID=3156878 RepID=UPI0033B1C877